MRAIRKLRPEPGAVETVEVDRPTPDDDEVLLCVGAAGVCGTDAHIYDWDGYEWMTTPVTLGHEFAGTVEAVGAAVDGFEEGDRVTAMPIRSCGTCFPCRNGQPNVCREFVGTGVHVDGGFVDYLALPAGQLLRVPEGLSTVAAALTEPLAIATHAVYDRAQVTPDDHVVVQGVGPIGVLAAVAVRSATPRSLTLLGTDADEAVRFPTVRDLGFDAVNVESEDAVGAIEARTAGRGADLVVDATGSPAGLGQALDLVRKGGTVVVVGTPAAESSVPVSSLVRGEVSVLGSYSARWRNFRQALALLGDAVAVDALTSTYPVEDPVAPMEDMLHNRAIKPVFRFDE